MLPIFRTISVGGVLLAITILALALTPPSGLRRQFTAAQASGHGALLDRGEHPEWRQFLIRAAVRRADELDRLRELPDTPIRLPDIPAMSPVQLPGDEDMPNAAVGAKTAGLPASRPDTDPDGDETGSITGATGATIPIDIGEPSSVELPVMPAEEKPPAVMMPERVESTAPVRSAIEGRRVSTPRRRAIAAPPKPAQAPVPFNFLQQFFDSFLTGKPTPAKASPRRSRAATNKQQPKRPAVIRAVSQ